MLTFAQLAAFEWLDTPMWVFDLGLRRMAWANASGLVFWSASDLPNLQSRDFSDLSEGTVTRLENVMRGHALGETVREQWTLYPKGKPTTVRSHSAAVLLEDGREAILYEGVVAPQEVDPMVLRGVEAMQKTSVRVALYDLDGRTLMRNPSAVKAFGSVESGALVDAFARMFADMSLPAAIREAIATEQTYSAEQELLCDGERVWHGLDVCRVSDPVTGKPAIQVNARDISELRRAQHEQREALAAAEHANRAKSQFLATMSHEIRTPMNGILGMAQLLLTPNLDPSEQLEFTETILQSGRALLTLLNDILDLSKIEAGKLDISPAEFTPNEVLRDTVMLFAETASKRGLKLLTQWEGPSLTYVGDSLRMRQMLSNLVSNAIKFSEGGQITIVAAQPDSGPDGAQLCFSVADSGVGIAPDKLAQLFTPFTQVDGSHVRRFAGTGLGLSIVRRLAELMGGHVGVESVEGKGSRFWFTVRAQIGGASIRRSESARREAARAAASPLLQATAPEGTGQLVLLVEDNNVNRIVAQRMLKKWGCVVVCVEDGAKALSAITEDLMTPELVLMDCQMPVMDGFDATRRIRQWEQGQPPPYRRLPIVALTANAFQEEMDECRTAGMDDVLSKPIEYFTLAAALAQWLTPGHERLPRS